MPTIISRRAFGLGSLALASSAILPAIAAAQQPAAQQPAPRQPAQPKKPAKQETKPKPKQEEKPKPKPKEKGESKPNEGEENDDAGTEKSETKKPETKAKGETPEGGDDKPEVKDDKKDPKKPEDPEKKDEEKKDEKPEKEPCKIEKFWIKGKRSASKEGVIQIVAEANQNTSIDNGCFEAMKTGKELMKALEEAHSFKDFVHEADEISEKRSTTLKAGMKTFWGGQAELAVKPKTECKEGHEMVLSGPGGTKTFGKEAELPAEMKFKPSSGKGTGSDAKPTVYTVTAKNCDGQPKNLRVEVYPSNHQLAMIGFDTNKGIFGTSRTV